MPFTFSHPAVFVPLVWFFKSRVSVTGLVMGSIAPDFEYFIRMQGKSEYGHRLDGVLWFDLPLGLLVAFVFHGYVRNTVIQHLPALLRGRLLNELRFDWNRHFFRYPVAVLVSFLVGSLSHLAWDGFTHAVAFKIREFAEGYVAVDESEDFLIYYLFFGLNSLAGLWVLFFYVRQLPYQKPAPRTGFPFPYWTVVALWAILFLMVRVLTGGDLFWLGYVDSAITATLTGVLAATFLKKKYLRRKFGRAD